LEIKAMILNFHHFEQAIHSPSAAASLAVFLGSLATIGLAGVLACFLVRWS
jgi:hypothetical protein